MKTYQLATHSDSKQGFAVRTVAVQGSVWFCADDVLRCVGFKTSRVLEHIDADDMKTVFTDGPNGREKVAAVSMCGLHVLIFRSRKPEAKAFRRWMWDSVIPTARKAIERDATVADMVRHPGKWVKILTEWANRREALASV